jgi:VCPO second helical-bundle domain
MKGMRLGLAVVGAVVALALPAVAHANEVTTWNSIALNTVAAEPAISSAPNATAVFMAMTQGAVYGAVNAIDRHGRPYLVERSFPKASLDAAVATAAYRVLDTTFPDQHATLTAAYNSSLAGVPPGSAKDTGVEVGEAAAAAMLAQGHDARAVIGCAFGVFVPGVWQPLAGPTGDPLCDPTPWVRDAPTFLVNGPLQFRTAGPYALDSAAYAADYNEVKDLGSLNSATRTPSQTHLAVFWQSNPGPNYNLLAQRFVAEKSLNTIESARLFAMIDLNAADAIITAWSDKYARLFWRPMAAIRHGAEDGNTATAADPTWTPLFTPSLPAAIAGVGPPLNTPPYPEHPSGAVTYASATMHAFQSFFGTDNESFYVTSSRFPGEQLHFDRFSDLIDQIVEARIWAGIHFRNADLQAANLGREVEAWTHTHQFASVH